MTEKEMVCTEFGSEYYTEKEVSDMDIMGDNFREYLYGWDDAFVQGKGICLCVNIYKIF